MAIKYYLGIDVGKYYHQACLTDNQGKVLFFLKFKALYQGFQELLKYLNKQIDKSSFLKTQIGLEATGIYWLPLYEQFNKLGMKVTVLNPLQVKACQNQNIRGNKTDQLDSQLIAKILRFGQYSSSVIPDEDNLALRQLTRLRSDLVDLIKGLKVKTMGLIDQVFPEYKELFQNTFSTSSRKILGQAVLPEKIAALSTGKLARILTQASRGRLGEKRARKIKRMARQSLGITLAMDAFSLSIKVLLAQVEHLEKQVKCIEKEVVRLLGQRKTTLASIPGVGPITAATIRAEIGDFTRFANDKNGAQKLVALAGIDPRIRESGQYKGQAKMSKRGSPYLRRALHQAAFSAVHVAKDPMFKSLYQKHLNKGKHTEVALSHVQRKLLHVVYSLLKNNRPYKTYQGSYQTAS